MILDKFLLLFEADTQSVQKGTKKAEKDAEKLNKTLSKVDKTSSTVGDSFTNLIATAGGALTALLSVGGISKGILNAATYTDDLAKFSDRLGENANDISAWGQAVKRSGGNVSGFQSTVENLSSQFAEFVNTGTTSSLPYFSRLGISMVDAAGNARKVLDVLPELSDSFQKLSKQESAGLGKKLGLDKGTITLLQKGRRSLDDLIQRQRLLFEVTKKDEKVAQDWKDVIDDTSIAFTGLAVKMGTAVLPAFEFLLKKVQEVIIFFREHSDFAVGLFAAMGGAITLYLLPPLAKMSIAMLTAFSPFLLIGAAVVAVSLLFALLYDDILTFVNGGSSAFGKLLEWIGMSEKEISKVRDNIKRFFSAEFWNSIWDGMTMTFSDKIKEIMQMFKSAIDFISNPTKGIKDFLGFGDGNSELIQTATMKLSSANASPFNNINSNAISNMSRNTSKSVTVDKIEIHTQATDSKEISKNIGTSLQQELKNATNNFDDNIEA